MMSQPNWEYKDSVLKDLFSDEAAALDLYNALTGRRFTIDDGLCFTTLENALFMGQLNDVSFTIGDKLFRSEVHNMLFTEFNLDEAKEVWFEEGREEGRLENAERLLEIARAMFVDGDSLEKIARNTKLPMETLKEKLTIQ